MRAGGPTRQQWQRAARLADRYGRSLTMGEPVPLDEDGRLDADGPDGPAPTAPARGADRTLETGRRVASSATDPHRSPDGYHGAYNDYLWRLAMADGDLPDVVLPPADRPDPGPSSGRDRT